MSYYTYPFGNIDNKQNLFSCSWTNNAESCKQVRNSEEDWENYQAHWEENQKVEG